MKTDGRFLIPFFLTFFIFTGFDKVGPPPEALLGPVSEIELTPVLKKLLIIKQPSLRERSKIEYLIARVRQSRLAFIRNGEAHTGARAAQHLAWKYYRHIGGVHTVQDFIENIASVSIQSGQPYYVQFPDGTVYRLRDILVNELRALEEYLAAHRMLEPAAVPIEND